jgi:hypothetical protein
VATPTIEERLETLEARLRASSIAIGSIVSKKYDDRLKFVETHLAKAIEAMSAVVESDDARSETVKKVAAMAQGSMRNALTAMEEIMALRKDFAKFQESYVEFVGLVKTRLDVVEDEIVKMASKPDNDSSAN